MAWTEKYVSVAGGGAHDGSSEANAWTLAEAIAAYAAGQRINVIAGTYENTTTDRTFGTAGTTTAPIWWRGYNSTIGDLDADFTTAKPAITFTTGGFLVTAAHQYFSNLNISGARTAGAIIVATGGNLRFDRVRVENTGTNANSQAIRAATNNDVAFTRGWLKATASATRVCALECRSILAGTVVQGGGRGAEALTSGTTYMILNNVFDNIGGDAIYLNISSGYFIVIGNSIYSPTGDGIEIVAASVAVIANNIFDSCTYGITNSSGGNINTVTRLHNAFYNSGTANENGFGDAPSFSEVAESASPFTNAAGADFSLLSTALSKAAGMPGLFENSSYTSYLDIGAVQREEPGVGGGNSAPIFGGAIIR